MSNLLDTLMENNRKPEIDFGISKGCVFISASNDIKKKKDGDIINRFSFIKVGQVNSVGKLFKETEISWFNVDPSTDWAYDNFFAYLKQSSAIVRLIYPISEEENKWGDIFSKILASIGIDETEEAVRDAVSDSKKCPELMKILGDTVTLIIKNHLKDNKSPVFNIKLVFEKTGKYLQQPRYDSFVELDGAEGLTITQQELDYKAVGENTQTPVKSVAADLL